MLDIPERTIRRHIKEGMLKGTKIGGTWRFSEEDLTNYINHANIRQSQQKLALSKIMEYMNGFNSKDNEVVFIKNIENLDYSKSMKISLIVKTLKNPLYFNMSKTGKISTITFKGNEEDALVFLREIKEITL
ncbi:MAG: helix-turn-helix domain-containing protein [Lutibacter sp.]|nr:helix-turn-helix domain-containing protein [Lutibacter sp.]